jgi:Taurine catabolism dioxygenase TauD, TfdA family
MRGGLRSVSGAETGPECAPPEMPLPWFDAPSDQPFAWLAGLAAAIRDRMLAHGVVLLRGLPLRGPTDLARARRALGISPFTPPEVFAERRDLGEGVVSPIRWPDDRLLCPLQEGAFSTVFPAVVLTACVTPPERGGQARVCDTRLMASHLPADLCDRVRAGGWTMTRIFHDGFGTSWTTAFSVADHAELAEVLAAESIQYRCLPDGVLHTVRRRPGVINHPVTGEECWFNQMAFLNAASMEPHERTVLTKAFGKDLPVNSAFGDGTPLSESDVAVIQNAYDAVTRSITWESGDLLVADNIISAQGRAPFAGDPEFLVALGGQFEPSKSKG